MKLTKAEIYRRCAVTILSALSISVVMGWLFNSADASTAKRQADHYTLAYTQERNNSQVKAVVFQLSGVPTNINKRG